MWDTDVMARSYSSHFETMREKSRELQRRGIFELLSVYLQPLPPDFLLDERSQPLCV